VHRKTTGLTSIYSPAHPGQPSRFVGSAPPPSRPARPAGLSASAFTTDALFSTSFRHEAGKKSFVVAGANGVPAKSATNAAPSSPCLHRDVSVPALPDPTGTAALRGCPR
jgi:hypothetical protein